MNYKVLLGLGAVLLILVGAFYVGLKVGSNDQSSEQLGSTRFPNGLITSTLSLSGAATLSSTLAVTSTTTLTGCVVFQATTTECYQSGSFADATTTLFALANPFFGIGTSTAYVERYDVYTGATGSISFSVGTTTFGAGISVKAMTAHPSLTGLLNQIPLATNTSGFFSSGVRFGTGQTQLAAASTTPGIIIGPNEHLVSYATGTELEIGAGGLLNTNNTFNGVYKVRYVR